MTLFDHLRVVGPLAVAKPSPARAGLLRPLLLLGLAMAALTELREEAYAETRPPMLKAAVQHFSRDTLVREAKELAAKPYVPPADGKRAPGEQIASTYDEYRMARFRPEAAIQLDPLGRYRLHLLPAAWIHKEEIEVLLVDNGQATPVTGDPSMFDWGPLKKVAAFSERVPLSGIRIRGPLNSEEVSDDIIVFQGASYFRALSRGQAYGISARGLALATGSAAGEEFPRFTKFWIERPAPNVDELMIHALLDSKSLTGAYTFKVRPGAPTAIDVEAAIFPRVEITEIGLAPLTSMYLLSASDRTRVSDFRPAVHDSDGLAIHNGSGEYLWRPLANPRGIQTSFFIDDNPKGFGLEQRERSFAAYQDLEALYHDRPSVWIEPQGNWGKGSVILVELPTETEANDNIVAFWRPEQPLAAGRAHQFSYRLTWPDTFRRIGPKARVVRTMAGLSIGADREQGTVQFVLEFSGADGIGEDLPLPSLEASEGRVSEAQVHLNPESGTLRVAFKYYPEASETAELRLALSGVDGGAETWLYRWTKGMHQ